MSDEKGAHLVKNQNACYDLLYWQVSSDILIINKCLKLYAVSKYIFEKVFLMNREFVFHIPFVLNKLLKYWHVFY